MMRWLSGFFVVLIAAQFAAADDVEGSVSVVGNRVIVQAVRGDRSPANNAPVRIVKGDSVVAEGRINFEGFWLTELPKAGTYEVCLGASGDEETRIPISIASDASAESENRPPCCVGPFLSTWSEPPAATPPDIPWPTTLAGIGLIVAALGLYVGFKSSAA